MGHAQLPPSQLLQLGTGTARHWIDICLQQGCTMRSSNVAEHVRRAPRSGKLLSGWHLLCKR